MMDGLMTGLMLVIMLIIAPDLAVIVLAAAALYAILRWVAYTPLRQASMEAIVWKARLDTHFLETLRGIRIIKLFNGQEDRRTHWLNLLVETTNRQLATQKLAFLFRTGNKLLMGVLTILIIWFCAQRVLDNALTIGLMLAFISYKDQFIGRVTILIDRAVDLKMLRLHAERLADIALTEPETRTSLMPQPGGHIPPAIELRNVSFRYSEHEPWVLDNVNLRIEAEKSLAITGPSGGGKSTLLKLLAGLIQPTHGEILIDDEPLARIGIENYRARVGVVMQDDQLFAGSIADNICFFSERPDHDRILQCAQQAAIHNEIIAMPMGYGTLIGDMGTVLSGGQKQRVVIARALYRKPSILLLDEATSHLDVEREKMVNTAFAALRVTRVVIAHRPETIRMSGNVVALEQGKIFRADCADLKTFISACKSDREGDATVRPAASTIEVAHKATPSTAGNSIVSKRVHAKRRHRSRKIESVCDGAKGRPARVARLRQGKLQRGRCRSRKPVVEEAHPTSCLTNHSPDEVSLPKASFEMPSIAMPNDESQDGRHSPR
jgi:ATP-binding cassette subfamily B protein RaxB